MLLYDRFLSIIFKYLTVPFPDIIFAMILTCFFLHITWSTILGILITYIDHVWSPSAISPHSSIAMHAGLRMYLNYVGIVSKYAI